MDTEVEVEVEQRPVVRRKPGRKPKAPAETAAEAMSVADLVAALRAATGNDDESLQRRAKYEAEAHARLQRKENERHPGISVFSYPEGDLARPKTPLKCKMFWVGYPETPETLTPDEIDLFNRVDAVGTFMFHRTDGTLEKLTIEGEKDARGQWTRLLFHFPCQGQNKHNLPSKSALLREVIGESSSEGDLRAELGRLRQALAAATAH